MFPISDSIPSRTVPVTNYLLIAVCAAVFMIQVGSGSRGDAIVEQYGMIPYRVFHPNEPIEIVRTETQPEMTPFGVRLRKVRVRETLPPSPIPPILTLLTSIFLHGGWMHFLGNMWFLYIFGDNVEDRFGHVGFLFFYLACGILASLAHLFLHANSTVPTIGASGAIAGVMGAYFLLYPRAHIITLLPVFFIPYIVVLPASVFLGVWFLFQFFQGTAAITSIQTTGVAWWAHIGGFAAGMFFTWELQREERLRPPVTEVLPYAERTSHYRLTRERNPWQRRV